MSDDSDFDMEIVETNELDELGSSNESSSHRQLRSGRDENLEKVTDRQSGSSSAGGGSGELRSDHWAPEYSAVQDGFRVVNLNPVRIKVPEMWGVRSIDNLSEKVTDGAHQTPDYQESGVRFLSTKNLKPGRDSFDFSDYEKFISPSEHKELCKRVNPQKGDLLLSKSGTIGICQLVRNDLEFSIFVGLALIRPSSDTHKPFLEQVLNWDALRRTMRSRSPGSTRATLPIFALKDLRVPTPPLPEQRKIASVLYTVDQAIQKTEEIIVQGKRVKRGLMQSLLSQGLYDHELTETGTRFGKLPSTWRVKKLGEVGRIAGRTAPEKDDEECWGGEIPWATPSEITTLEGNRIAETKEYLTDRALEKVSSNLLPAGSILLTTRATVGACAVNEVPMTTNQGFKNVVPGDDLDTWYGYYRLTYESDQLEARAKGSTFREVGKETVENFEVPIPPIEEQEEIGKVLKSVDDQILNDREVARRLGRLKKGLMQDLLTGEVRTADKAIKVLEEVQAHG